MLCCRTCLPAYLPVLIFNRFCVDHIMRSQAQQVARETFLNSVDYDVFLFSTNVIGNIPTSPSTITDLRRSTHDTLSTKHSDLLDFCATCWLLTHRSFFVSLVQISQQIWMTDGVVVATFCGLSRFRLAEHGSLSMAHAFYALDENL